MKMSLGRAAALAAVPVLLLGIGAGSASAQPASGNPPPPKGFEAQSASFVSAQTGFVLGARDCSVLDGPVPCKALLEKTTSGGKHWAAVPAPAVNLTEHFSGTPASAVSSVRFATASDGWLFGPGLWATTDGGKRWQRVKLPGIVYMMATSGGEAYAAAEPPLGGPGEGHLYESAVGSGKWTLVPKVSPEITLTSFGHSAWTGVAPDLWRTTNSGKTWSRLSFKCPAGWAGSEVAAASVNDVAIACSNQGYPQPGFSVKEVFVSANGGRTFHQVLTEPPVVGQVYGLAMAVSRPSVITINAASGASYLDSTFNGGKAWTKTVYRDGGLGFADLQYASSTTGYVVHFMGIPQIAYTLGLMKTVNAGATWTNVPIP
jgi:photosystem II stability/assembly factor-like uncharacterized protein